MTSQLSRLLFAGTSVTWTLFRLLRLILGLSLGLSFGPSIEITNSVWASQIKGKPLFSDPSPSSTLDPLIPPIGIQNQTYQVYRRIYSHQWNADHRYWVFDQPTSIHYSHSADAFFNRDLRLFFHKNPSVPLFPNPDEIQWRLFNNSYSFTPQLKRLFTQPSAQLDFTPTKFRPSESTLVVSSPLDRQIFQRTTVDRGPILVSGEINDPDFMVHSFLKVEFFLNGQPVQPIISEPMTRTYEPINGGKFLLKYILPAGG
jgi:hypothetical protein